MARYMERAENLGRILEVNETFARDARGSNDWLPILKLHCDEERFFSRYREADATRVVRFYIIDLENPNSIAFSVRAARENARSIRHLISLETWFQLNVLWNWARSLGPRDLRLSHLSQLCTQIKEGCQLHTGIVTRTFYRDQVWLFYTLGSLIERCDQTTRLVDIKYHALLPHWKDVGSPIDIAQWNALLRSASAYHGYRRVYPHQMTPRSVAGFILLDPDFPRSIRLCVREIENTLARLLERAELEYARFEPAALTELKRLASRSEGEIIEMGLHEYLDYVQRRLIELGHEISTTFFGVSAPPASQAQNMTS
jgi:uncharacterized alpha-E superfamily protein